MTLTQKVSKSILKKMAEKPVMTYLDQEVYDKLIERAKSEDRSVASFVRRMIEKEIK